MIKGKVATQRGSSPKGWAAFGHLAEAIGGNGKVKPFL
jgi:hypothetical protein